jgi:hypothetical protein
MGKSTRTVATESASNAVVAVTQLYTEALANAELHIVQLEAALAQAKSDLAAMTKLVSDGTQKG